jgi:phosphatidylglycerol:prolipoprotein diacylglycerol transferase
MQPILFQQGDVVISSYAACMTLGLIAALAIVALEARQLNIRSALWLDAALAAITIGVISARLGYAAINWAYFKDHIGEVFQLWEGGLAWHAGLIGGSIGAWLIAHRSHDRSPLSILDLFSIGAPLGIAFAWIGSYLAAVAYGKELYPSGSFFFLAIDAPDWYGVTNPRWPSQLIGVGWAVVIFALIWLTRRKEWRAGIRFCLFIATYSFGAFLIGFTRGDDAPLAFGLRLDQVLDGLLVIVAIVSLVSLRGPRAQPAPIDQPRPADGTNP